MYNTANIKEFVEISKEYGFNTQDPEFNWKIIKEKRDKYFLILREPHFPPLALLKSWMPIISEFLINQVAIITKDLDISWIRMKSRSTMVSFFVLRPSWSLQAVYSPPTRHFIDKPLIPSTVPGIEYGKTSDDFFLLDVRSQLFTPFYVHRTFQRRPSLSAQVILLSS